MASNVAISFECLPLRAVTRMDIPLDASPKFQAVCERILAALAQHGKHNTYYLHRAQCTFHLTSAENVGTLEFEFEGTLFTDPTDTQTKGCDLQVELRRETCDWLTENVVEWFRETVRRAVIIEFDRYIATGDLEKTKERLDRLQAESDEKGGFIGMGI